VAPVYDRTVALVGWHRWRSELLSEVPRGTVLELGCGPAHLAPELQARGVEYVGLDRNPTMLRRARRTTHRVVRADAEALPFRDHCVDVVVATGVLALLTSPVRHVVLQEVARVCRGEVLLLEPFLRADHPTSPARARLLAFAADGPLHLDELTSVGLRPELLGPPRLAGVYSPVRAVPE
jgi:ubiquinone/menaquinone biosynthesis C-methylase UbiE